MTNLHTIVGMLILYDGDHYVLTHADPNLFIIEDVFGDGVEIITNINDIQIIDANFFHDKGVKITDCYSFCDDHNFIGIDITLIDDDPHDERFEIEISSLPSIGESGFKSVIDLPTQSHNLGSILRPLLATYRDFIGVIIDIYEDDET